MFRPLPLLLAFGLLAPSVTAQSCTFDDFESFVAPNPGGTANLYVGSLSDTTVLGVYGQGPGLVEDGCSYIAMGSLLSWTDAGYFGLASSSIQSGNDLAIVYDNPVDSVSFDLHALVGYPDTLNIRVYDAALNQLSNQMGIALAGGSTMNWSSSVSGIKRIEIQGLQNPFSPHLDNHLYCAGGAPVPTLTLVGNCGQAGSGIQATGMTANALIGIGYSPNAGSAVVNAGGCSAVAIGLGTPRTIYGTIGTDPLGEAMLLPINGLPAAVCGFYVQALDLTSCQLSNVLQI